MTTPVRLHRDGTVLAVRVVPGASRAEIVGLHGDELKVKVCSPPVDGRANEELLEVIAQALALRPRQLSVIGGHTSRSKQVLVQADLAEVERSLAAWIGPLGARER